MAGRIGDGRLDFKQRGSGFGRIERCHSDLRRLDGRTADAGRRRVNEVTAVREEVRPPMVCILLSPDRASSLQSVCRRARDPRRPGAGSPGENTITLSRLQVPPARCAGASQSTIGGPPVIAIFFSLPEAKNAMNRLSGDQNGKAPCSVRGSARLERCRTAAARAVRFRAAGDEHHVTAVRGDRDLSGDTGSTSGGTTECRVLRRRNRELHRTSCRRALAGGSEAMTAAAAARATTAAAQPTTRGDSIGAGATTVRGAASSLDPDATHLRSRRRSRALC